MRLICPNCGAQYEVPDEVIPEAGRDVQCSSCGHTWFQNHPDQDTELAEDLEQPVPDQEWTPEDPVEQDFDDPEDEYEPAPEPKSATEPVAVPQTRRRLDPSVSELLREEAEFETRARQAETNQLESQPDLGLEEPEELDEEEKRARQARIRMARMRGLPEDEVTAEPAAAAAATAAAAQSRRDLLPNIDEINSTLRSANERRTTTVDSAPLEAPKQKTGGFRKGFSLVVLIAVLMLALYVFAPKIIDLVPAAEPFLSSYVSMVNEWRIALDDTFTALLTKLDSMASTASDSGQ